MVVELVGGPLDGTFFDGPAQMPVYMLICSHQEGPIYRARCASDGGVDRAHSCAVKYHFLGYEQNISYEYPEKINCVQALEQKSQALSDS